MVTSIRLEGWPHPCYCWKHLDYETTFHLGMELGCNTRPLGLNFTRWANYGQKYYQEDDEEIDPDVRELGDYFNIEERWATWLSAPYLGAPPQKKGFLEVLINAQCWSQRNGSILFRTIYIFLHMVLINAQCWFSEGPFISTHVPGSKLPLFPYNRG